LEFICLADNISMINEEELKKAGFTQTRNLVWVYELDGLRLIYDKIDDEFYITAFSQKADDIVSVILKTETIEESLKAFLTFKDFWNLFV
jgi:hypothetical protein